MEKDNVLVQSTQIYRCSSDDRVVIVFKEYSAITGINYAQDKTLALDEFLQTWGKPDKDLTDFYHSVKYLSKGRDLTEIELINEVIWAHFNYNDKSKYNDNKHNY